jgi:CRP-like cAMP-binding protein/small-conductance mechanosensitive channel
MSIRSLVVFFNRRNPAHQISAILVQIVTIVAYALVGLLVYVVVYDKSFTNLIAASGMVVVALAYAFREMIANIMASIQLQLEGLVSINDWIEVTDASPSEFFQVVQIDHQMVTLLNVDKHLVRIPNREFLNYKYINITKQPNTKGVRRKIRIEITNTTPITQVLEVLDQAMQSVIETDSNFNSFYYCLLVEIKSGIYIYEIKYECHPCLSRARSNHVVNSAAIRFLLASGANVNYTVEIYPANTATDYVKQRLLAVREFGILKDLNQHEIDQLAKTVSMLRFKAGDAVIRYQEKADSMFILIEGTIDVSAPNEANTFVKVATLWPGSCVGEMSLMTGEPRSAQVIARTESVLLEIRKDDISPILESNLRLVEQMAELLAQRMAQTKTSLSHTDRVEEKHRLMGALAQKIKKFLFHRD